jgi:hypothetical protein
MRFPYSRFKTTVAVCLPLLFCVAGCSGRYPVHGKVTFEDGTPLTSGMVVFESTESGKRISPRGEIQSDGSYQLGMEKPGDGVPSGKYRALVSPRMDINAEKPERDMPIDKRFTSFDTSELEFEVKSGDNDFPIKVTKPSKRPR